MLQLGNGNWQLGWAEASPLFITWFLNSTVSYLFVSESWASKFLSATQTYTPLRRRAYTGARRSLSELKSWKMCVFPGRTKVEEDTGRRAKERLGWKRPLPCAVNTLFMRIHEKTNLKATLRLCSDSQRGGTRTHRHVFGAKLQRRRCCLCCFCCCCCGGSCSFLSPAAGPRVSGGGIYPVAAEQKECGRETRSSQAHRRWVRHGRRPAEMRVSGSAGICSIVPPAPPRAELRQEHEEHGRLCGKGASRVWIMLCFPVLEVKKYLKSTFKKKKIKSTF